MDSRLGSRRKPADLAPLSTAERGTVGGGAVWLALLPKNTEGGEKSLFLNMYRSCLCRLLNQRRKDGTRGWPLKIKHTCS